MSTALVIYENFAQSMKIAESLAASDMIPTHFQRKPSNVLIALEFAYRNDITPFVAMQSIFVIHGKPGMTAAMAIALALRHKKITGLHYVKTGEGDEMVITAKAKLPDGTPVECDVSMATAKKSGWTKNQIYQSLPEQMLKYRSATLLIRSHCPEVLFGMSTVDELQDISASKGQKINIDPIITIEGLAEPVTPQPQPASESQPEPQIETMERDIEDLRGELLDFLQSRPQAWFDKIGKVKSEMIDHVESEKEFSMMKKIHLKTQQYDKLAGI